MVIVVGHRQGSHESAAKNGYKGSNGPDRASHWVVLLVKEVFGCHTVKTQHALSGVLAGDALDPVISLFRGRCKKELSRLGQSFSV
jgi:hypothetical protein